MAGRHQATSTSKWKRKILGIPIIGWIVGISTTALAVVGFTILFGATGTVSSAPGIELEVATASAIQHTGDATCTASPNGTSGVNISMSDAEPGDRCQVNITVNNPGSADAQLQSFDLVSGDFSGGEITAGVVNCGGNTATAGGGSGTIAAILTAESTLGAAQTFTFDANQDGFFFVPNTEYVPGNCVEATP